MAGAYSIADIAIYPWIVPHERHKQQIGEFPQLKRWFEAIRARPATERAYAKAEQFKATPVSEEESRKVLYGQDARTVRRQPVAQNPR